MGPSRQAWVVIACVLLAIAACNGPGPTEAPRASIAPTVVTGATVPPAPPTPIPPTPTTQTVQTGPPAQSSTPTPPSVSPGQGQPNGSGDRGEGVPTADARLLQGCLLSAVGQRAFSEIAGGLRPPSADEAPLVSQCFARYGGQAGAGPDAVASTPAPSGQGSGLSRPGDATPNLERALWSATHSVTLPTASLITVSFEPGSPLGKARVSGAAGASLPGQSLTIVDLEIGLPTRVIADGSGAFEAVIDAAPGSHAFVAGTVGDAGSGLLFPIEPGETTVGASRLEDGSGGPPWLVTVDLQNRSLRPGQSLPIRGQVVFPMRLNAAPPSGTLYFMGTLVGDAHGQQVGLGAELVSAFLTPTGLPIERRFLRRFEDREIAQQVSVSWTQSGDFWQAEYATTLTVPADYPAGLYRLSALLQLDGSLDLAGARSDDRFVTLGNCCEASLGNFTVGAPASTRLAATILADVLDEGSRGGVRAAQDDGQFDVSARVAVRHDPVVPRSDGAGRPLAYRLEPYLPMFGAIDRKPPAVPPVLLDLTTSELTITITRPDGVKERLGPASLTHLSFNVPSPPPACYDQGISTGGHLSGLVQVRRSDDTFAYKFPTDGSYQVRLDGRVADYAGRSYEISGDYAVTVARPFKLSPALLPGTPFEIGDSLNLAVSVVPSAPAEITYTVTHVAGDGTTTKEVFTGRAGRHGYWDGDGKSFTFARDGEYRVDIEARYPTANGELWVGRMRFGSVVASANPPIVLHGRRGSNGIATLPPPWFVRSSFDPKREGHLFPSFFTGDIQWGEAASIGDDAVSFRNSIQIVDSSNPLAARALAQFRQYGEPLGDDISVEQQVTAGQIPLLTFQDAGRSRAAMHPDDISLWAYSYGSAQRPGVRVREFIQGADVENAYWSFQDPYHLQSGNGPEGDLPGDFKFLYAGGVLRDTTTQQGAYAIYGSGWVLAPDDDPQHARVFPPFQGAAGGPNGGPIFTVHGREVDLFFMPLGVGPGSMLETGDTFRMAGPVMPTLPSLVRYTVIAPDGVERTFQGRANGIGYYYDSANDFELDQAGLWTVRVGVTHDGMTSAGPVSEPYPTGGVLSPDGATYTFVVNDPNSDALTVKSSLQGVPASSWYCHSVRQATFEAAVPDGMRVDRAHVTVAIPGTVLVDEDVSVESSSVRWELDALALNRLASNFDFDPGIADTIMVTFSMTGSVAGAPAHRSGGMVSHGARLARIEP